MKKKNAKHQLKALLFTNEYPPHVYGGAGVHIDNLSKELAKLCKVDVRCFGPQRSNKPNLKIKGYQNIAPGKYISKSINRVHDALERCINFNSDYINADIVHAHTWYTHFAGILAKLDYSIPLVLTAHSLEPLRPWKREQLGSGYNFSTWIEKTAIEMADAVIAVSNETKNDIVRLFRIAKRKIHVIPNGIDPELYKPVRNEKAIRKLGIDPKKPFVLFVGRITRQKGIIHLVNAIKYMDKDYQVVLCASSPDTQKIAKEMESQIKKARKAHPHIIWITEMVDKKTAVALYSHANVFCCPSVYEPFGIINIEAMACETPVVATAVGGIKEVVKNNETGLLVPIPHKNDNPQEIDSEKLSRNLATKINQLMKDENLRIQFGKAGRQRVIDNYTWKAVAQTTFNLYKKLTKK